MPPSPAIVTPALVLAPRVASGARSALSRILRGRHPLLSEHSAHGCLARRILLRNLFVLLLALSFRDVGGKLRVPLGTKVLLLLPPDRRPRRDQSSQRRGGGGGGGGGSLASVGELLLSRELKFRCFPV